MADEAARAASMSRRCRRPRLPSSAACCHAAVGNPVDSTAQVYNDMSLVT